MLTLLKTVLNTVRTTEIKPSNRCCKRSNGAGKKFRLDDASRSNGLRKIPHGRWQPLERPTIGHLCDPYIESRELLAVYMFYQVFIHRNETKSKHASTDLACVTTSLREKRETPPDSLGITWHLKTALRFCYFKSGLMSNMHVHHTISKTHERYSAVKGEFTGDGPY